MARGNNREPIFFDDQDRQTYLRMLHEAKRRYGCALYAYVLMTNHVHFMVRTGQEHSISRFMQSLQTAYTMHTHRKYHRVGHLFQGRFRSSHVEQDAYALELSRYIHLNPVRAGLVDRPEQYRWSSYGAYLRGGDRSGMVDCHLILKMLGDVPASTTRQFHQFTLEGLRSPSFPWGQTWV